MLLLPVIEFDELKSKQWLGASTIRIKILSSKTKMGKTQNYAKRTYGSPKGQCISTLYIQYIHKVRT